MPYLFIFLLKVNLALLVFCAGYYLVLRRLTYYTLNRIYLIAAILFASIYPKLNISEFLQHHQRIAEPVQAIAFTLQAPPRNLIKPIVYHHGYWQYAGFIFWAGVILFALRLLVQFISLYRIYHNSRKGRLHGYDVRLISGDGGPFSFWKNIYVNPEKHDPADLQSILQHEQVHVSEWHTADILLAEISTVFYWFNPGIWLMKKAIRENIEFITDRKILQNGADSKQYQYSLVNVSFAAAPQGIVNHFNISTIKKRIIMMNAKRSSKLDLTRYAFLVPAVVVLLLIVTVSHAALVKKNSRYHSAETAIKNKVFSVFYTKKTPGKLGVTDKKQIQYVSRDTTTHIKVATVAPTDTNKKVALKYKKLVIEPSMYIVDGVVTKDYDISKVDTSEIVSINIGKSFKDGKAVVYVVTKNGMTIKPITAIRVNGYPAKNLNGEVISGNLIYTDSVRTVDGHLITVEGHPSLDTVYVKGFQPSAGLTVSAFKPSKKPQTYKTEPFKTSTYSMQTYGSPEFSLNRLSDKLIIINGNVATTTDLKKLSAFDIDRMVLKTDSETKELYGDKAKNGVVFIVTKKKS